MSNSVEQTPAKYFGSGKASSQLEGPVKVVCVGDNLVLDLLVGRDSPRVVTREGTSGTPNQLWDFEVQSSRRGGDSVFIKNANTGTYVRTSGHGTGAHLVLDRVPELFLRGFGAFFNYTISPDGSNLVLTANGQGALVTLKERGTSDSQVWRTENE